MILYGFLRVHDQVQRNGRFPKFGYLESTLRKKVEPKQLPRGAVLKIGALLQGGADFFLNNHV